jgi:hypothetical protein
LHSDADPVRVYTLDHYDHLPFIVFDPSRLDHPHIEKHRRDR